MMKCKYCKQEISEKNILDGYIKFTNKEELIRAIIKVEKLGFKRVRGNDAEDGTIIKATGGKWWIAIEESLMDWYTEIENT